MTDLSQIGEELRRLERERRKSHDRALVSLFIEEQGERTSAMRSVGDAVIGAFCALILLGFIVPDLVAWLHGLPPVLVTP